MFLRQVILVGTRPFLSQTVDLNFPVWLSPNPCYMYNGNPLRVWISSQENRNCSFLLLSLHCNIFPHDTGKCFYYCVEDTWLEGISSYFNVDKEFLSLKFTSNVILKTFLHMYLFTILLILSDVWFWRLDFSREMQNLFFSVSSTLNSSKI